MFNLINPPRVDNGRGITILPQYAYLKTRLFSEYEKVKDYYQTNLFMVKNDHLLVKLLIELSCYIDSSPDYLVNMIRAASNRLESAYGLNSSIVGRGVMQTTNLYNRLCKEVWISVQYDFNVEQCYKNWKRLKPVRCVSHPFTDVNMVVPTGEYLSKEQGVVVMTIDLAMLALQYKAWCEFERQPDPHQPALPTHVFVHRYVLTNLVSIQTDIAIFNRLHHKLKGLEIAKPRQSNPFLVVDYGDRIDAVHEQLLGIWKSKSSDYQHYLGSIPSLEYPSYHRSVWFPDMAPTRQIKWALVLAHLRNIEFLLDIDDHNGNTTLNLLVRQNLLRTLITLKNESAIHTSLDQVTIDRITAIHDRLKLA